MDGFKFDGGDPDYYRQLGGEAEEKALEHTKVRAGYKAGISGRRTAGAMGLVEALGRGAMGREGRDADKRLRVAEWRRFSHNAVEPAQLDCFLLASISNKGRVRHSPGIEPIRTQTRPAVVVLTSFG